MMQSIMDRNVSCPFYGNVFIGATADSALNRHLKGKATKSEAKRGSHPGLDSPRFKKAYVERRCWSKSKNENEKQERKAKNQRNYKEKAKRNLEDRIRTAFVQLK
jgi:hypothetical protein